MAVRSARAATVRIWCVIALTVMGALIIVGGISQQTVKARSEMAASAVER
jgi:hypothetical protein